MEEFEKFEKKDTSSFKYLLLLNAGSFVERTLEGIALGYFSHRAGMNYDISNLGYLGLGTIIEGSMDLIGETPIINRNAERYLRFSKKKLKESLKDDIGSIAGWALGGAIGQYFARME